MAAEAMWSEKLICRGKIVDWFSEGVARRMQSCADASKGA